MERYGFYASVTWVDGRLKHLLSLGTHGDANSQLPQTPALGRVFRLLVLGSLGGLVFGVMASRALAAIVYQATPRDPLVLGGVIA